ncbi:hypothetical protein FGIG_09858 [Fasciola gigantica]|uniref:Uncharacterized protein n=1 Tax=Fasciola gigantica TaxID=46835 RepID=A0A504YZ52_FASGI|nr:hypothetical protein FGIG_09858 [Fasciola gigantica]
MLEKPLSVLSFPNDQQTEDYHPVHRLKQATGSDYLKITTAEVLSKLLCAWKGPFIVHKMFPDEAGLQSFHRRSTTTSFGTFQPPKAKRGTSRRPKSARIGRCSGMWSSPGRWNNNCTADSAVLEGVAV